MLTWILIGLLVALWNDYAFMNDEQFQQYHNLMKKELEEQGLIVKDYTRQTTFAAATIIWPVYLIGLIKSKFTKS